MLAYYQLLHLLVNNTWFKFEDGSVNIQDKSQEVGGAELLYYQVPFVFVYFTLFIRHFIVSRNTESLKNTELETVFMLKLNNTLPDKVVSVRKGS